jgi:tetratricopeptide (TPR) repeat protein
MPGTQYATPEQQKSWLKLVVQLYASQKDYAKVVDTGEAVLKKVPNDPNTLISIADAQNQLGEYKEAAATVEQVVDHQDKPEEKFLVFQWNCYIKANDDADAVTVNDKLITYYPKPDYWQNALASLQSKNIKDEHLQLEVYRLMSAVGVLKRPFDFGEMADIALDLGYPGESQSVLEQAQTQNVFTEPADKDRNQHLLDSARRRAATDRASLAAGGRDAGKAATGDALVQIGIAYLTYGQAAKAVADITDGIAKGMLKYPDEAYLALGMAQLEVKNSTEALRAFEKVASSSSPDYARLGKLWALRVRTPPEPSPQPL